MINVGSDLCYLKACEPLTYLRKLHIFAINALKDFYDEILYIHKFKGSSSNPPHGYTESLESMSMKYAQSYSVIIVSQVL